jgi:protein farnesyltransferase/geranylgeranyltransferase type-1 subunit alpha
MNTHDPKDKPLFAERQEWSDVEPVPQYETGTPVAPILYTPECALSVDCLSRGKTIHCNSTDKDATDYFRAVVKSGERSRRVLELTEELIRLNPAHYTAW